MNKLLKVIATILCSISILAVVWVFLQISSGGYFTRTPKTGAALLTVGTVVCIAAAAIGIKIVGSKQIK